MDEKIKNLIECDLYIKRIPRKDLDWFKQYAKEEYAGDYGMLLKELINFYKGMYMDTMLSGLELMHLKLDKLIEGLTPKEKESSSKAIKMANGREIKRG